jgi:hypothetical protein
MTRRAAQLDLLHQVGVWLAPLEQVLANPTAFPAPERARIRATFGPNAETLRNQCLDFTRPSPGVDYAAEFHDIQEPLAHLQRLSRSMVDPPPSMAFDVMTLRRRLQDAILAVPTETDGAVYEAGTPFTTHLRIRELCSTARRHLLFVDRYLDASIFHRYLDSGAPGRQLVILTWPEARHTGRYLVRFREFLDVSRLYAAEFPGHYRLLVNDAIHDRYVWADDALFHIGGSLKDAADRTPCTLTRAQNTDAVLAPVRGLFDRATELFGPATPTHP